MISASFQIDGEVDPEKFVPWINEISQSFGPQLLRYKGILAFRGEDRKFVLQGVHMILDGDLQLPWKDGEARVSKLVVIGRELDLKAIEAGFRATAV